MKTNCRDCCYPEVVNNEACGCCEGVKPLTPLPTANRPGLSQLSYRIGSHSSFLETMIARLSNSDFPQLAGLTTRDTEDPSMALLDGWASVADVLTFYQERIANEGYLRTATERRSILELARLVGYKLRPGVSSSVFLAYTIDKNIKEETTIPTGSRAQSVPGPGELPQSFETSEDLKARAIWNNLRPRMTQPQTLGSTLNNPNGSRVYLKGINTNLKPNDPLLIDVGSGKPQFSRIVDVLPDAIADRTLVTLKLNGVSNDAGEVSGAILTDKLRDDVRLIKELTLPPSIQHRNSLQLKRTLAEQFMPKANTGYEVMGAFSPELRETLSVAVGNATVTETNIKIYALHVKSSLFGHNLPLPVCPEGTNSPDLSCCVPEIPQKSGAVNATAVESFFNSSENDSVRNSGIDVTAKEDKSNTRMLALDAEYKELKQGTWVAVDNGEKTEVFKAVAIKTETLGGLLKGRLSFFATCPPVTLTANTSEGFGISIGKATKIKSTILELDSPWIDDSSDNEILRKSIFYGQSEELELAEEPIEVPVCGDTDESGLLELDSFYEGLESGRWVIVSGERVIDGTSGVRFSELAMLSSVTQDVLKESQQSATSNNDGESPRSGEKVHTFVKLANDLAFCFKRDTVTIYGNVVKATHGETRKEVLGSGEGSKALQSFDLKQSPLTHVSASNPTGVDSTLSVFVNDIEWHESDSLAGLHATDRLFVTRTGDDSKTSVIFGNGREGARLPTGIENVRAEYRNGIGKGGNVNAEQISLLATKPLGVKEVINPLRASGGADRENRDRARKSAPLAVMTLDRLVSVRDYEDFARLYAGIGKSDAVKISDGCRQLVHVTIAGADDIPIDETSDLFQNLRQALHDFGDPYQPIQLAVRELMFIVISANVQIQADYQWEPVVVNVRAAMLDAFSFERRELAQDVLLSEMISMMQAVQGVEYVDVDAFGGIPEKKAYCVGDKCNRRLLTPDEIVKEVQCLINWKDGDGCNSTSQKNIKQPAQRLTVDMGRIDKVKTKHTIQPGDTLTSIAEKYETTIDKLVRLNNIHNPNLIYAGDVLLINSARVMKPAQLAFLTPDVPDTLILNQIK